MSLLIAVPRLVSATYFEEVATATLQAMFACAEEAFAAGAYAGHARILRGVVDLRPEGSYQRLFGIDRSTGARMERVPAGGRLGYVLAMPSLSPVIASPRLLEISLSSSSR